MRISNVIPQLRTTDLASSVSFYTEILGFTLQFQHDDFYASVASGEHVLHLKLVEEPDPSISFVEREEHFHLYFETPDVDALARELARAGVSLVKGAHETAWGTRECVIKDNAGHVLYFGQQL